MRRAAPALTLAALLSAAPAAVHAQAGGGPVVDGFRSLCVATGGDRTAALAAADRDGWAPVPDALLSSFAGQFKNASGRLKSTPAGIAFLILGEQDRTEAAHTLHMTACGVGGSTTDPAAVAAAVQAYAGVPRSDRSAGDTNVWAYADEAGRHAPLSFSDAAAMRAAIERHAARVLFERTSPSPSPALPGQMVVIVLAVPSGEPGAN